MRRRRQSHARRWGLAPLGLLAVGVGLGVGLGSGLGPGGPLGPRLARAGGGRLRAEAYFSPNGGAELAIQQAIDHARGEVLCAVYLLTSRRLALALKRAHGRGVSVRIITDRSTTRMRVSKARELEKAGIAVRYAALGYTADHQPIKFHHKYAVIDRQSVLTGSFNWTRQADTDNRENLVVLHGRGLARRFVQNFEKEWAALTP